MGEKMERIGTVYLDGVPLGWAGMEILDTVAEELGEIDPPELAKLEKLDFDIEIDSEEMKAALTAAAKALNGVADAATEMARQLLDAFRELVESLGQAIETGMAFNWAEKCRPDLVGRYRHTKKGRIRKKYMKRIVAAWRKEAAGE